MDFPIIVENSKIPVILSKIAPIEIYAISLGLFIFCRDKLPEKIWRHEMIHYRQQRELWFFIFFILYIYYYLNGLLEYRNSKLAYLESPFEREAHDNQTNPLYLIRRKKHAWKKYRD